ncbi:MAG: efflux RND transporter periplasmic adaptor subunit [Trichocoleus desertorum ATA4-8-CV12]|jgi:RND family efflux transporter MFP subunit|nr:efflux RND transporter periplasmic adaptor subunit [Trichocoleus desertorum ATA4-8-CV12]
MNNRWNVNEISKSKLSGRARRILAWGVVASILVLGFLLIPILKSAAIDKSNSTVEISIDKAMAVEIVSPISREITRQLTVAGGFAARDEIVVGSDAPVRWNRVLVDIGSSVEEGQLLAQGDDSVLVAQLAQQEALLVQAEARFKLARENLGRAQQVQAAGIYSVEALDAKQNDAAVAAAQVSAIRAQIREVTARIAQTRVFSPVKGLVTHRAASVGAVTPPGGELFRIIKNSQVEWQAEVPEKELQQIREGSLASVDLGRGLKIEGRVRAVAPSVAKSTRRGIVYVSLPVHRDVRSGGHATGSIEIGRARVLVLPIRVVQYRDGIPFVYTVNERNIAETRTLSLGVQDGEHVEVTGIGQEARVVSTGAGFVKAGERLHVSALTRGASQ